MCRSTTYTKVLSYMKSLPYYTVPFKFSNESLKWLVENSKDIITNYDSGLLHLNTEDRSMWINSPVWREILEFTTKRLSLSPGPHLQFFLYKKNKTTTFWQANPHIDTHPGPTGTDDTKDSVPVRFNILLIGDEDQEMVWWDIDRNHPVMEIGTCLRDDGIVTKRIQVKGNTTKEKWAALNTPTWKTNKPLTKFNEYSSFVRTDILHALNWTTNNDRLILSVRFLIPWEELVAIVTYSMNNT